MKINGKFTAFWKYSGRFPGFVAAAHFSLITMASAVTSGDTGWHNQLHGRTNCWFFLALSHCSSPGEGYDFQVKDGGAQQEGGEGCGNMKLLHWEL